MVEATDVMIDIPHMSGTDTFIGMNVRLKHKFISKNKLILQETIFLKQHQHRKI